ncbi:MAG: hypothetical protein ACOZNI_26950, partial [Myxococcota bacterium]
MSRTLLPVTLSLLLAPAVAFAGEDPSAALGSGAPEVAARSSGGHGQARKSDRRGGDDKRAPSNGG